ncbi:MAG: AAA family ATPase [Saprospiraceae bacterium]|nr:AAA family ATPase [Saprospiraceae bacterium]
MDMPEIGIPQIEYLKVKNYRALQNIELKAITPLTVFLGPNGSGKSTIFDVFAFLSECFNTGLRKAWDKRGRFRELRSRGQNGPIEFMIKYREYRGSPLITYHLAIDEGPKGPLVSSESLRWKRREKSQPFYFLRFQNGKGEVVSGDMPDEHDERVREELSSPDMLAVNTLGQLAKHPRVGALRRFISDWYLSYLSADNTRGITEAGPVERLSQTGDNLPNVIQFLKEEHPERLDEILATLSDRIPRLEKVDVGMMQDGRLLMQIKDAPFEQPVLAKFASDGTLKMLAYLTVLYDPSPPQLIGIEEPENQLHPRLLPELAEECRKASGNSQLLVTTHSPFFVNGLKPEEVWVIYRDVDGFSKMRRCSDMPRIKEFIKQGALLGHLWMEGHFDVGDPLNQK